ncbi:MAG TPA: hypothetical protein VFA70_01820 [Dehalococcoidia bacterium]|nr:hypothetical protein [Dehalococcoidia bacterium]
MQSPAIVQVPADVRPIKRAMALFTEGNVLSGRQGNLFLFPDRIAHVSARGAAAAFGLLGLMVSRSRAERRARGAGHGVTTLMLRDVIAVRAARYGLRGGMLDVDTRAGGHYRVGVKYEQWRDALRQAFASQGITVDDTADGLQVAGAPPSSAPPA